MYRILLIIIIICVGCSPKNKESAAVINKFSIPIIIQEGNIDTVKPFSADNMMGVFPDLIGKYRFGDTIHYNNVKREYQSLHEKQEDYLWEVRDIFENDSLSSDGLQIIPDYKTSLAFNWLEKTKYLYYPVYVVNETFEAKVFYGKDRHGFAIQEAIDTSNYSLWNPIESEGFDFCGNGRFRKKLDPGEYLMFLMPKYSGQLNTSLRIRFQIGQNIFISRSFPGAIDPRQFTIDKEDWVHHRLKKSKGTASSWLFYGGVPKEINNYYHPE